MDDDDPYGDLEWRDEPVTLETAVCEGCGETFDDYALTDGLCEDCQIAVTWEGLHAQMREGA